MEEAAAMRIQAETMIRVGQLMIRVDLINNPGYIHFSPYIIASICILSFPFRFQEKLELEDLVDIYSTLHL